MQPAAATVVAAGTKVLLGTFGPNAGGIDETILRTVGGVMVASDNYLSPESQFGSFGLIAVTDIAAAAGAASIPGPSTDAGDDWFIHRAFAQESNVQTNVGSDIPSSVYYEFDSKAKRIIDGTGIVLAVMVENIHATHGFTVLVQFRFLSQVRGTG